MLSLADILLELDITSPAALFDTIGQGVAIPHGRLAGLRQTRAAYARPRRPQPFNAPDGTPGLLRIAGLVNHAGAHLPRVWRSAYGVERTAPVRLPTRPDLFAKLQGDIRSTGTTARPSGNG